MARARVGGGASCIARQAAHPTSITTHAADARGNPGAGSVSEI
jgi:hypothetical protein